MTPEAFWDLCTEPSGGHFWVVAGLIHLVPSDPKPWPLPLISQNNETFMTVRVYVCVLCVVVCVRMHMYAYVYLDMYDRLCLRTCMFKNLKASQNPQQLHQSSGDSGGKSMAVSNLIFAAATWNAITYCSPRQRVRSTSRAERIKSQGTICPQGNEVIRKCSVLRLIALAG